MSHPGAPSFFSFKQVIFPERWRRKGKCEKEKRAKEEWGIDKQAEEVGVGWSGAGLGNATVTENMRTIEGDSRGINIFSVEYHLIRELYAWLFISNFYLLVILIRIEFDL